MSENKFCAWHEDAEDAAWETDCGQYWQFNDGGPAENNCRFCHYCGKPIDAQPYENDDQPEPLDLLEAALEARGNDDPRRA